MSKRATIAMLAGAALAAILVASPAISDEKKAAAKDTAVKGEILDLSCYVGHGGSGPGHAECAASCLKGGAAMGLLGADGTVYVLFADHSDSGPFEQEKGFAGKKVEVTGEVHSKGNLKGITMHGVKAL